MGNLSISVIICVYTEDRWDHICAAVESIRAQSVPSTELILVVDHNEELFARLVDTQPGVMVIRNREARGLSGARNTAVAAAKGEIIAFLDDDAFAQSDWLELLSRAYEDPEIIGVGGLTRPRWQTKRPRWMPEEFDWVVGCNYRGMPPSGAPVRNLMGGNMSFRREVFDFVPEGFRTDLGRSMDKRPLGCEETEFCIKLRERKPDVKLVMEHRARIWHYVPAIRCRFSYFVARCYAEGLSKARMSASVGWEAGLSSERGYATRVLPLGVARGAADICCGDIGGLGRVGAIVAGLCVTGGGYIAGIMRSRPELSGHGRRREFNDPIRAIMRVLITGGAGFIGSHLSDAFLARGCEVCVVDDLSTGRESRLHEQVALYKETILDAGRLISVAEEARPDIICHLAAHVDTATSVQFPADDTQTNVLGTVHVLEAARQVRARLLFCSSSAVYGENPSVPFSEGTAPMPISPYGVAKYCGEQYVELYDRLYGVQHAILRFSNVYGPRQSLDRTTGVIAAFCSRALQGQPLTVFGDGKQTRDFIYVGDCVSAMLAAVDCGVSGTWNIATAQEVSILELIEAINEIVPLVEPQFVPSRSGEPLRSALAPAVAQRDLGWRPAMSLADGVRAVFDWIKEGAPDRGPC